ncbi:MAG: hypothetical protein HY517_01765, partial [Candidatus Aenigmarchaeota archaeon]|nr:hypothetical protein [Candidatus Aenigmarchaeota archaeon]
DQHFIGPGKPSRCLIEHAYFMNPDSVFNGILTDTVRRHVGRLVARRYSNRIRGDIVVPVMESGISYAYGISDELGIPVELCMAKNHDIGRTFMVPEGKDLVTPEIFKLSREETAALKHRAIPEKIRGRRCIGAEDTVIRANVIRPVTKYLIESGAMGVDWLVGHPTVGYPCYYGKNHSTREELVAAGFEDQEEAGRYIASRLTNGAPVSVNFGTLDDWMEALRTLGVDNPEESYCSACHDGKYPTGLSHAGSFISLSELKGNSATV